eukprot:2351813-Rhodomonas_salina.1
MHTLCITAHTHAVHHSTYTCCAAQHMHTLCITADYAACAPASASGAGERGQEEDCLLYTSDAADDM